MPALVGAVQVISIGTGGVFNIGDVFQIQPLSSAKTYSGAGSFNTGDGLNVYNHQSATNTFDPDVIDQANAFNV
jgi:spore germination protein PA